MHLFDELHVYHDREPVSAAMNMAIDEALLEFVTAPSLRFYGWRAPSLSFGYFGAFADIAKDLPQREVVRRWTGGGIVLHGTDLTYSLILPAQDEAPLPSARTIYLQVHEGIRRALSSRVSVALAERDAPKLSDSCFANPVTADVLANGKKIAGAAQRRTRRGLLHQGSIQEIELPADFADIFSRELCPGFVRKELPNEWIDRARGLSEKKYASDAWLHQC